MGIWEALRWTADNLPRGPPDIQPVKDACWSACGLGQTAAGAIGTAAMVGAARAGGLIRHAVNLTPVTAAAPQQKNFHSSGYEGSREKREERMGIWEALQSTADSLPRDLQPVKDACLNVCGLGQAAAGAVGTVAMGGAARAGGLIRSAAVSLTPVTAAVPQRIKDTVTDPDCREKIERTVWILTDLILAEATKPYTGGLPVYRTVKEGWAKGPSQGHAGTADEVLRNRIEQLEARLERMEAEGLAPLSNPQPPRAVDGGVA